VKGKSLSLFTIQFYLLTKYVQSPVAALNSDLVLLFHEPVPVTLHVTFTSLTVALESPQQTCEVDVTTLPAPADPYHR
jgi:hypothetical protein